MFTALYCFMAAMALVTALRQPRSATFLRAALFIVTGYLLVGGIFRPAIFHETLGKATLVSIVAALLVIALARDEAGQRTRYVLMWRNLPDTLRFLRP